ncbi:MAG: response regulator [Magnetococcales bacterium]|nr:response regulator [Magnetococcales bacterium]
MNHSSPSIWNKAWHLSVAELDDDHIKLVQEIDKLISPSTKTEKEFLRLKDNLILIAQEHFRKEQIIAKDIGYAFDQDHLIEHEDFLMQMRSFIKYDNVRINSHFIGWLNKHILFHDKKLAGFIEDQIAFPNRPFYNGQSYEDIDLFKDIPYDSFESILKFCPVLEIEQNEIVLDPDRENRYIFFILDGQLSYHLKNANTERIAVINEGKCVGELSLIDNQKPSGYIKALTKISLLALNKNYYHVLTQMDSILSYNMNDLLAIRMRENTEKLNQLRIFKQIQSVVYSLDGEGRFTYVTDSIEDLLGYSKEEIEKKKFFSDILLNEDEKEEYNTAIKVFQEMSQSMDADKLYQDRNIELILARKKEEEEEIQSVIAEVHFTEIIPGAMPKSGVDYISGIIHDISHHKDKEKKLRQAEKAAKEASKIKSEFIANMSHEFRTPLTAIIGYAALMNNTSSGESEAARIIISQANNLSRLVDDILDFSKIEANKLTISQENINIGQVFLEVFDTVRHQILNNENSFRTFYGGKVPLNLVGDPKSLHRILVNLVGNAAKFTTKGDITLSVELEEITQDHVILRFSVKDTGSGIDEQDQQKLFAPFVQADSSLTRNHGGTGLGLSICKGLVERMRGKIWLESRKGVGSEFIFLASFEKPQDIDRRFDHIRVLRLPKDEWAKRHVLILCENNIDMHLLEKYAKSFSFRSHKATSLDQANNTLAIRNIAEDYIMIIIRSDHVTGEQFKDFNIPIVTIPKLTEKPFLRKDFFNLFTEALGFRSNIPKQPTITPPLPSLHGARILIVEDQIIIQELLERSLKHNGCIIHIAENGEVAVNKVKNEVIDLVLMDIQMPVKDGFTASREIRSLGFLDLPIIALTASTDTEDEDAFSSSGINQVIKKPFDLDDVNKVISRYLNKKRSSVSGNTGPANQPSADSEAYDGAIMIPEGVYGINTKIGMGYCKSSDIYNSICKKVYEQYNHIASEINFALNAGDLDKARTLLHTFRGTIGTIGAENLDKLSTYLHHAIKNKEMEEIKRSFDAFNTEFDKVMESIKTYISKLKQG